MKHISFSTLIIALISLSSLEAMELQTIPHTPLFTFEQGKMVYTDAYWDQRRAAQKEASERLVTHQQNEYTFKLLLAAEQQEPQEARWKKIEPLVASVGAYLSINAKLRRKLFKHICLLVDEETKTVHEQNITYDTWLKLVNPEAYKARFAQEVVPPLPPLPATCLTLQEHQTAIETFVPDLYNPTEDSNISEQQTSSKDCKSPEPSIVKQQSSIEKQKDAQPSALIPAGITVKKRKMGRFQQQATPNKKAPAAKTKSTSLRTEPVLSKEELGYAEFWQALLQNKVQEVKTICASCKIDLNKSRSGETKPPLLTCVAENMPLMAECLLDLGANPNTPTAIRLAGKKGWLKTTPLSFSIETKKIDFVELLLKHKADPDIKAEWIPSRKFEFPLNTAIAKKTKDDTDSKSRKAIAKLLLAHGVTNFFGNVYLWDTTTGRSKSLDLKKEKSYIQELMARIEKLQITDNTITIHAKK